MLEMFLDWKGYPLSNSLCRMKLAPLKKKASCNTTIMTKVRKPRLALLLSLLCAPLGYIYAGYLGRGFVVSLLVLLLFPASVFFIKVHLNITILVLVLALVLLLSAALLVDVYRSAKRHCKEYSVKFYNKWWVYALVYIVYSFVCFPLAQHYTKEYLVQAYKIPAGSMLPTLMIGDHFFVDKRIYNSEAIEHGDLVVFPFPQNPKIDYIKRVIGLPGDEVQIINKELFLNKILQTSPSSVYTDTRILSGSDSPRDNFGPVTVPEDSVFVLGDNRDNSYDSRFWGFVPLDTVKGKLINIYWSWDTDQAKVRWDRIGLEVE